jgi:hypothetical protein
MVGMTLLFGFVTYYADTYHKGIGGQVRELLVVEDIWINPPGAPDPSAYPVNITIYNAGKIESQITSVYVNGTALTENAISSNFNLNDQTVDVGEHIELLLYRHHSWPSGHVYIFTIGTKSGSTFDVTYRYP